MARSFSLVDQKVAEAAFFLERLEQAGRDTFAMRCFCSAFVASTRSVTFAIQAVMADVPEFSAWYSRHQESLKANPNARFFHQFRRINQHIGENLARAGVMRGGEVLHFFTPTHDVPTVPSGDVVSECRRYFRTVLEIAFDSYEKLGPFIDARQRYTARYFETSGLSIEDAEEELGFPPGWTDAGDPDATPYRWQALRDQVSGCEINHVFAKYLNHVVPEPARLPEYSRPSKA